MRRRGSRSLPGVVAQRVENGSRGFFENGVYRGLSDRPTVADVVGARRRVGGGVDGGGRVGAGDRRHPGGWLAVDELPALLSDRYHFGGHGVVVAEHPAEAKDDRPAPKAGEHSGGRFSGVSGDRLGSRLDRRGGNEGLSAVVGMRGTRWNTPQVDRRRGRSTLARVANSAARARERCRRRSLVARPGRSGSVIRTTAVPASGLAPVRPSTMSVSWVA